MPSRNTEIAEKTLTSDDASSALRGEDVMDEGCKGRDASAVGADESSVRIVAFSAGAAAAAAAAGGITASSGGSFWTSMCGGFSSMAAAALVEL